MWAEPDLRNSSRPAGATQPGCQPGSTSPPATEDTSPLSSWTICGQDLKLEAPSSWAEFSVDLGSEEMWYYFHLQITEQYVPGYLHNQLFFFWYELVYSQNTFFSALINSSFLEKKVTLRIPPASTSQEWRCGGGCDLAHGCDLAVSWTVHTKKQNSTFSNYSSEVALERSWIAELFIVVSCAERYSYICIHSFCSQMILAR